MKSLGVNSYQGENDDSLLDELNKIKNFAFLNCKEQSNAEIYSKLFKFEMFNVFNPIINYYSKPPY